MVVGSNPTGCKNIVQIHTKGVVTIITVIMPGNKKVEKAQVLKNVGE